MKRLHPQITRFPDIGSRMTPLDEDGERVLAIVLVDRHEQDFAYTALATVMKQFLARPGTHTFMPEVKTLKTWWGLAGDAAVWPVPPVGAAETDRFIASIEHSMSARQAERTAPAVSLAAVSASLIAEVEQRLGLTFTRSQKNCYGL